RVRRAPGDRQDGGEGRRVDDPAGALPLHDGNDGLAHQEGALQIDIEVQVPGVLGQGLDGTAGRDAGVVHEHIAATERPGDVIDHGAGPRRVPDVADVLVSRPALAPAFAGDVVEQVLADVRDDGRRALAGEGAGDLAA